MWRVKRILDLPASVADYLYSLVYEQRALAYLLVDSSLTLVRAAGTLEYYGLEGLQVGRPACEEAVFLEGLLPLIESPLLLQSVQMPSGRAADLHLYSNAQGYWVLLLDVTIERYEAWRLQQKAYDLSLLRQQEAQLVGQLEAANLALQRKTETVQLLQAFIAQVREASELILANLRRSAELIQSFKQMAVDETGPDEEPP